MGDHGKIFFLLVLLCIFINPARTACAQKDSYTIPKFWNENINYAFHYQISSNSCGPACVQTVLDFFGVYPLPSQEELAEEMNTTLRDYTYTEYVHVPFQNREIEVVFDGHLNNIDAVKQVKGNVSLNRPAILLMWYDTSNVTSHYRVMTGYNETGFFFHDPAKPENLYSGSNIYFDNMLFKELWTMHDNWILILESREQHALPWDDLNLQLIVVASVLIMLVIIAIVAYHKRTKTESLPEEMDKTVGSAQLMQKIRDLFLHMIIATCNVEMAISHLRARID